MQNIRQKSSSFLQRNRNTITKSATEKIKWRIFNIARKKKVIKREEKFIHDTNCVCKFSLFLPSSSERKNVCNVTIDNLIVVVWWKLKQISTIKSNFLHFFFFMRRQATTTRKMWSENLDFSKKKTKIGRKWKISSVFIKLRAFNVLAKCGKGVILPFDFEYFLKFA